jgi:hypothetical protein
LPVSFLAWSPASFSAAPAASFQPVISIDQPVNRRGMQNGFYMRNLRRVRSPCPMGAFPVTTQVYWTYTFG